MKKLIALLLAMTVLLSMTACNRKEETDETGAETITQTAATEDRTDEVITVTYYCSIGAYLSTLQREIDKWNEGRGKAEGVYIRLESNINTYYEDLEASMRAGNHYDLIDAGTGNAHWKTKGWIKDLNGVANKELSAIIEGYEDYLVDGVNTAMGPDGEYILHSLPLEIVPIKMVINQDLFDRFQLDAPKTWADVIRCAQVITEGTDGQAYGYGATNWDAFWRRMHMKAFSSSFETIWWDPNTETYSFDQYEQIVKGLATMQKNGWMTGLEDTAIDPIRAQFAEGKIGMLIAPSYDFGVYTSQFVARCNWTVIDVPTVGDAPVAKGVYLDRVGCAIDAVSYDAASAAKQEAIVKAFCFLNSDELNAAIYASGGMIPYKADLIAGTQVQTAQPQWAQFSDITNYMSCVRYPDDVITLEGDDYSTVFGAIVRGELEWSADLIQDMEDRYNEAYRTAKEDPDIDTSIYAYTYKRIRE